MDQQPMQQQAPAPQVEEPKQGGSLKWLLIILVVVIVGAVALWYFTK